jgi:hypothetical protein
LPSWVPVADHQSLSGVVVWGIGEEKRDECMTDSHCIGFFSPQPIFWLLIFQLEMRQRFIEKATNNQKVWGLLKLRESQRAQAILSFARRRFVYIIWAPFKHFYLYHSPFFSSSSLSLSLFLFGEDFVHGFLYLAPSYYFSFLSSVIQRKDTYQQ